MSGATPEWLAVAYGAGAADGDAIGALDLALGSALHDGDDPASALASVDADLAGVDASRLSPAMAVGLLRFTFPVSDMLPAWAALRERVREDLSRRPGLDVGGLLQGLG